MERFKPRDMFVEAGYGPNFADQLLQNAYSKLFEGDPIDERICFNASDDMAYGGWGQVQHGDASAYVPGEKTPHVRVYIPARTAIVLVPKSKLKAAEKN